MKCWRLWPVIALLLLCCIQETWGAARFYTSFDRNTVELGETVTLSLVFEEESPQAPPNLPAIPGLQIQYLGPSREYRIVNGQASSTVTFNYHVLPQKAGEFAIPAFSIQIGGQTLSSQPITLKVLPTGAQAGADGRSGANELAFVRIVLPKTNLFVGESVLAEIQLFIQQGKPQQYPQLTAEGFTVGKMGEPKQSRTQSGNSIYNVFVFPLAITPARTGMLPFGPVTCASEVVIQPRGRRSLGNPFSIFDDFLERRQVNVTGEPVPVNAQPLPAQNVPPGFSGAVGKFSLSLGITPTNVSVGEPITLRIRISGRGTLDTASLPTPVGWDQFKLYPPSSKIEVTDALGLDGIKTFEQVITPQNLDVKEVPVVSFVYFDPDERQYKTLRQGPVPIVVSPASSVNLAALPTGTTPGAAPRTPELAHIKNRLGILQPIQVPLLNRPGFWGLQLIPIALWLASLIYRYTQDKLLSDPRLQRQRHAERAVRDGLKQLRRLAQTAQTEEFFAVLFRVIQEQIGATLNLPASGITEADLEERLRPAGFDPAVLDQLHALLQVCDQARYSRQHTAADLASLLPRLEQCLRALQSFVSPQESKLSS